MTFFSSRIPGDPAPWVRLRGLGAAWLILGSRIGFETRLNKNGLLQFLLAIFDLGNRASSEAVSGATPLYTQFIELLSISYQSYPNQTWIFFLYRGSGILAIWKSNI